MKRSELVAVIKEGLLEAGCYTEDEEETAEEVAGDIAGSIDDRYSVVDEEEDEEEEEY